jgi:hypothetical protein
MCLYFMILTSSFVEESRIGEISNFMQFLCLISRISRDVEMDMKIKKQAYNEYHLSNLYLQCDFIYGYCSD